MTSTAPPVVSFGPVQQVVAGVLDVGYVDTGPTGGPAVVLLHGWPYDVHSFAEVTPALAATGCRVVVPFVRGYGTTRFLADDAVRNGQQAAVASDVVALMDALEIDRAVLAGFDRGARSADVVAALWPQRCAGLVSVSGHLIGSQAANAAPLPPEAELAWWYEFSFATERGRAGYERYRREFTRLIWRLGLAAGEPRYDDLERRLAEAPTIAVPTITLEGDANGAPHPDAAAYAQRFPGRYEHRVVTGGVGHNLPQEAPEAFTRAVLDVLG